MADPPADDRDGASARILALPSAVISRSQRIVAAISSYSNAIINSCSRSRSDSGLPLPPTVNIMVMGDMYPVTEKVVQNTLLHLHFVQNQIRCWKQHAEGISFPIVSFDKDLQTRFDPEEFIKSHPYLDGISDKTRDAICVLTQLRFALGRFLSNVYIEIDLYGKQVSSVMAKHSLLSGLDRSFMNLQESITEIEDLAQIRSLSFDKLQDTLDVLEPHTADFNMRASVNVILLNQSRLDKFLTLVLANYSKPWTQCISYPHAFGAIAFSLLTIWVVRHSNISFKQILEPITAFMSCYVVQPLSRLRDGLFKISCKEEHKLMEIKQVEATSNLLHELLLKFTLRTTGQEFPDKQMFDIAMDSFVKQVNYPLRNLLIGDLLELTIIRVQRLKLDLGRARVYWNQKVVNPNGLNSAIIWTLPTIYIPVHLLGKLCACIKKQIAIAECKEREQNRALFLEVKKRIKQCIKDIPQNQYEDLDRTTYLHGIAMYTLDRLYKAVEMNAKAAGEWPRLREDMIRLQQLSYHMDEVRHLRIILEHMKKYTCLQ